MDKLSLKVENREKVGSGHAGRLRRSGRIPAVIYGKAGAKSLSVEEMEFRMMMRGAHGSQNPVVEIEDDKGQKALSIVQDTQRDPVTDRFTHIDFHEISAKDKIRVEVPVHVVGTAKGIRNSGGTLDIVMHSVEVECLPMAVPNDIPVNVEELDLNDSLHVSQLPAMEGIVYTSDPDQTVVSVSPPTLEDEPEEPEGDESAEVPTVAETEAEAEEGEEEEEKG